MLKTKLNVTVVIGLAMIGFFLGQVIPAVAATTVPSPSRTIPVKKAAVKNAAGSTSHKKTKIAKKTEVMKGLASVYSDKLRGRKTSSGQRYNPEKMTAAHRSLPIGTKVLVTNLKNNKSVEVFINDRGPFHRDRVIDLASAAASKLGMKKRGFVQVRLQILHKEGVGNS